MAAKRARYSLQEAINLIVNENSDLSDLDIDNYNNNDSDYLPAAECASSEDNDHVSDGGMSSDAETTNQQSQSEVYWQKYILIL